jgi:signal transduction histidine kinase
VGFAKVTRDLTERKKHEETLRRANELLRQQQRELERLNLSKDEFISLASHQLRTPATATKLLLGMLIEGYRGSLDESQLQLVQKAYESNERQVALVNGLLQVAQIDSGRVGLHPTETNVSQLLYDVVEEHMDTAKSRLLKLWLEAPETPVYADIDTDYFRMAIDNLLDNALKYTCEYGEVQLQLREEGDCFAIAIQDSGVGIAEEDIGKLFEKFMRIPNKLSKSVSGTGLGLYWTQRVIALHGGKIDVRSKLNEGTTFTITMPKGVKHA